jgi:hypothetical protein
MGCVRLLLCAFDLTFPDSGGSERVRGSCRRFSKPADRCHRGEVARAGGAGPVRAHASSSRARNRASTGRQHPDPIRGSVHRTAPSHPNSERFLAKRIDASTVEIDAGHLSLISHPQEVAELILQAARAGAASGDRHDRDAPKLASRSEPIDPALEATDVAR